MGGAKAHYDGIVAFSQTDFTEDLKKITVPVLVMHSEDDQIVPYVAAGPLVREAVEERNPENLQGLSARHAHDASGHHQRGSAGVPQELKFFWDTGAALGLRAFPGLRRETWGTLFPAQFNCETCVPGRTTFLAKMRYLGENRRGSR